MCFVSCKLTEVRCVVLPNYSESDFADAFQSCLLGDHGLKGLREFSALYREVACRDGRADFVAVAENHGRCGTRSSGSALPCKLTESAATVMSLLKPNSPRTLEYLTLHSGLTRDTTKRTLRDLASAGAVRTTASCSYLLGAAWQRPLGDLWAFELKLHDWRRALFQACQYQTFADSVCIVLPDRQSPYNNVRSDVLSAIGVGLVLFNPYTNCVRIQVQPRRSRPASLQHVYFAHSSLTQMDRCQ